MHEPIHNGDGIYIATILEGHPNSGVCMGYPNEPIHNGNEFLLLWLLNRIILYKM